MGLLTEGLRSSQNQGSLKHFTYPSQDLGLVPKSLRKEIRRMWKSCCNSSIRKKEFYKKYDWEVDYVGNPVLERDQAIEPNPNFLVKHGFSKGKPIVALLPGSRRMELKFIVPLMTPDSGKGIKDFQFAVAGGGRDGRLPLFTLKQLQEVKFIEADTYNLLRGLHRRRSSLPARLP